jgi:hypothetical protein
MSKWYSPALRGAVDKMLTKVEGEGEGEEREGTS